jgi:hypothetical protein
MLPTMIEIPHANLFLDQVEEGGGRRSESDMVDSILFEFLVDPFKPATNTIPMKDRGGAL